MNLCSCNTAVFSCQDPWGHSQICLISQRLINSDGLSLGFLSSCRLSIMKEREREKRGRVHICAMAAYTFFFKGPSSTFSNHHHHRHHHHHQLKLFRTKRETTDFVEHPERENFPVSFHSHSYSHVENPFQSFNYNQ